MAVERPILTEGMVWRAETAGVHHPVIDVLNQHSPRILQLNQQFAGILDNQEQQRWIRRHYGFLADAVVAAGPFTVRADELIAIWARAREVFSVNHRYSNYHGYALGEIVANAYAVQGTENPDWQTFPRHYLETRRLPKGVAEDIQGLGRVLARYSDLHDALDDINVYVYGSKKSGIELGAGLGRRLRAGDPDAERELDEMAARQKKYSTPDITALTENFGNAVPPIRMMIDEFVEKLPAAKKVLVDMARRAYEGEKLRGQIIRAERWDQLFATPEEAEADFLSGLVGESRRYFEENRAPYQYRIEPNPDGDVHVVERYPGDDTRFQRLANGDVIMTFNDPEKGPRPNLITPSAGNIAHPYTFTNTIKPDLQVILDLIPNKEKTAEIEEAVGADPMSFSFYLDGKPATQGWEEVMLGNGYLPQRIGHRLYPDFALAAQVKFAAAYPELMPGSK